MHKDLSFTGNLCVSFDLDLNGHTLNVSDTLTVVYGDVLVNGGTLNVGSYIQSEGMKLILNSNNDVKNVHVLESFLIDDWSDLQFGSNVTVNVNTYVTGNHTVLNGPGTNYWAPSNPDTLNGTFAKGIWQENSYCYIEYPIYNTSGTVTEYRRGYVPDANVSESFGANDYNSTTAYIEDGSVYNLPSTSSQNLGTFTDYVPLTILDEENGMYYIQYNYDRYGAPKRGYVEKNRIFQAATAIALAEDNMQLIVGDEYDLSVTFTPSNTKNRDLNWTSSNSNIVAITPTGQISAIAVGSAVITVTAKAGGATDSCVVNVEEPWVELSTDLVSNIGGPPRYFPDGVEITAENRERYYEGEMYTARYFLDYVWPVQVDYWDSKNTPINERTTWYTVYTNWARETYGLTWLEKFWQCADAFLLGVSDSVASTLEGIWILITDKEQVIEGMNFILQAIVKDGEERELLNEIISTTIDQCWEDFTGSAESRSRLIGRIAGEILIDFIAAKGVTKAIESFKGTKIFSKAQTLIAKGRLKADDAVQFLTRYSNFSKSMQSKIDDLLDSANSVRKQIEPLYDVEKSTGNVGVALAQIDGVQPELKAYSKITNESNLGADLGYVLKKSNPQFTVTETWRLTDTESKILEEVASKLGDNRNATGAIQLFTERPPCESCKGVIAQFRAKYPNIQLTVLDSNLNSY